MGGLTEVLKVRKGKDQSGQENLSKMGVGKWKGGEKRVQSM